MEYACVFPFTWWGNILNECTTVNDVKPLCSRISVIARSPVLLQTNYNLLLINLKWVQPRNWYTDYFCWWCQTMVFHWWCQEFCYTINQPPSSNHQVRPRKPGSAEVYSGLESDHTMCQYKKAVCNTIGRELNDDKLFWTNTMNWDEELQYFQSRKRL